MKAQALSLHFVEFSASRDAAGSVLNKLVGGTSKAAGRNSVASGFRVPARATSPHVPARTQITPDLSSTAPARPIQADSEVAGNASNLRGTAWRSGGSTIPSSPPPPHPKEPSQPDPLPRRAGLKGKPDAQTSRFMEPGQPDAQASPDWQKVGKTSASSPVAASARRTSFEGANPVLNGSGASAQSPDFSPCARPVLPSAGSREAVSGAAQAPPSSPPEVRIAPRNQITQTQLNMQRSRAMQQPPNQALPEQKQLWQAPQGPGEGVAIQWRQPWEGVPDRSTFPEGIRPSSPMRFPGLTSWSSDNLAQGPALPGNMISGLPQNMRSSFRGGRAWSPQPQRNPNPFNAAGIPVSGSSPMMRDRSPKMSHPSAAAVRYSSPPQPGHIG